MKRTADSVVIFDTTLRDGEQSPGASMNLEEKLRIARHLAEMRTDVIEAGFPIASDGDFAAVRAIAREVRGPRIAGLARCKRTDIDRAWEALRLAGKPRIHVFLATSPVHRTYKLGMEKNEILDAISEHVAYARSLCGDVEFSAEDASRTEPAFLAQAVSAAVRAGAATVNIPDTVGYAMPGPFGELIASLFEHVPELEQTVLSVHCHNDLGMAVANSLAAIQAGARQVECTINGIGERAGNCSLEELVMALRTRQDFYHMNTGIRTNLLYPASQLVSRITGMAVQPNKAVVGKNAFAHEAGIHQHGVLAHSETYEIMRPEDVGVNSNALVMGKHSGRHAFRLWIEKNGYRLDEHRLERTFREFKALADRKKNVRDADLHRLVEANGSPDWQSVR